MVLALGKSVAPPCGGPGFDSRAGGWVTMVVTLLGNVR